MNTWNYCYTHFIQFDTSWCPLCSYPTTEQPLVASEVGGIEQQNAFINDTHPYNSLKPAIPTRNYCYTHSIHFDNSWCPLCGSPPLVRPLVAAEVGEIECSK